MNSRTFHAKRLERSDQLVSMHTAALYAYWNEKRGTRARPAWSELDLMDIHPSAPHMMVWDVADDSDVYRVRYWGTSIREISGIEGTGKTSEDLYGGPEREYGLIAMHAAIRDCHPMRVIGTVSALVAKQYITYEGVHLPLSGTHGDPGHLISAYTSDIDPAHIPKD